jgi:heme oxygenase
VLSSVSWLLKQQTASSHERVEASLGLLDRDLSAARLRLVLGRFAGFWPGAERGIECWAAGQPVAAAQLNWPRRRRSELVRRDLGRLGWSASRVAELPTAVPPFRVGIVTDAEVLGWLYVSEGSTLGGAVIDRRLRAVQSDQPLTGLRTFTPYPEGPGPMWRAYLDYLATWVGDDAQRCADVVEAGQVCFATLERWLAPIAATVSA